MVFIFSPCFIESIKNLVAFAEANPLYLDDILDMINGAKPPAGNIDGYYLIDPFGTKIVYTIEILPEYKLRHFSISINNGKTVPPVVIVEEIMSLLGFKSKLSDCIVEIERRESAPDIGILNVAEKI
jgi:hypothetical protein